MGNIGWYLIVFGLASGAVSFLDREFTLLSWIGFWGEGVAWFIRAALVAAGWALIEVDRRKMAQGRQEQEPLGPLV